MSTIESLPMTREEVRAQAKAIQAAKTQALKEAFESKLIDAIESGDVLSTDLVQQYVKPQMIADTSYEIVRAMTEAPAVMNGMSKNMKDALLTYVKVIGREAEASITPLSSRMAELTLHTMLSHVFTFDGDVVGNGDDGMIRSSHALVNLFDSLGLKASQELALYAVITSENSDLKKLGALLTGILTSPCFSYEAKEVAKRAVIQGQKPFEFVQQWMDMPKCDRASFVIPMNPALKPELLEFVKQDQLKLARLLFSSVDSVLGADGSRFWKDVVLDSTTAVESTTYVVLADAGLDLKVEKLVGQVRYKGPVSVATPWESSDGFGGYPSNEEIKSEPIVRGVGVKTVLGDMAVKCIDALQRVQFSVNSFTLAQAKELNEIQASRVAAVKGQVDENGMSIKASPLKIGKFVAAKGVHYTKSLVSQSIIKAATEWEESEFVIPWNADYRGRMYPIATVLSMQSTDFGKAMVRFVDAQPVVIGVTSKWLSIHLANTFGMDKISLDARVEWANENISLIESVATSPVEHLLAWADGTEQTPDEPWQFLAACEEFYALFLAPAAQRREKTGLPIATDCSCSGLQILAGVTKDANAAKLVNVSPSDLPQDAYGAVAAEVVKALSVPVVVNVPKRDDAGAIMKTAKGATKYVKQTFDFSSYVSIITRKVVKKAVMTLNYNAAPMTQRADIMSVLRDIGFGDVPNAERGAFASAVSNEVRAAMKLLLPEVIAFKEWVGAMAKAQSLAEGVIKFATPAGSVIEQKKNIVETIELYTSSSKSHKVKCAVAFTDEVNEAGHKTCTMPNMVHALDASILHMAFAEFDKPFALIHDSVVTTASDMGSAVLAYKIAYVKHFGTSKFFKSLTTDVFPSAVSEVDELPQGSLWVTSAMRSDYLLA